MKRVRLSGGEAGRIMFCRLMVQKPPTALFTGEK
jgi:hypothetical protein